MNNLLVLFEHYWWVGLIVLVVGWGVPMAYWEIQRRRNPVQAQFVVTLGCLMACYYLSGIVTFLLTILACLKHLFTGH